MLYRDTDHRLDEIDRRILYALMGDARDTSTNMLVTEAGVSRATIRSRIHKLEDSSIIHDSTVQVDFKLASGRLAGLYLCDVPVTEREALAHEARAAPGAINIRTLMTGRRNPHVLTADESTDDLRHTTRLLTDIGVHIEGKDLFEGELFAPYGPSDPGDGGHAPEVNDFISLTGDVDVAEALVQSDTPITNLTLEDASGWGILDDETFVIAIGRGDRELTPHGDTVIEPDDIVTILSHADGGADTSVLSAFRGPQTELSPG